MIKRPTLQCDHTTMSLLQLIAQNEKMGAKCTAATASVWSASQMQRSNPPMGRIQCCRTPASQPPPPPPPPQQPPPPLEGDEQLGPRISRLQALPESHGPHREARLTGKGQGCVEQGACWALPQALRSPRPLPGRHRHRLAFPIPLLLTRQVDHIVISGQIHPMLLLLLLPLLLLLLLLLSRPWCLLAGGAQPLGFISCRGRCRGTPPCPPADPIAGSSQGRFAAGSWRAHSCSGLQLSHALAERWHARGAATAWGRRWGGAGAGRSG